MSETGIVGRRQLEIDAAGPADSTRAMMARELIAARARIAELERLLMGLSQEDREALDKLLDMAHDWLAESDPRWHEVAILRRLGGQTT